MKWCVEGDLEEVDGGVWRERRGEFSEVRVSGDESDGVFVSVLEL